MTVYRHRMPSTSSSIERQFSRTQVGCYICVWLQWLKQIEVTEAALTQKMIDLENEKVSLRVSGVFVKILQNHPNFIHSSQLSVEESSIKALFRGTFSLSLYFMTPDIALGNKTCCRILELLLPEKHPCLSGTDNIS